MKLLAPLNVMADIETPSTKANAAILSIAAVAFDQEGNTVGHDFYVTISLQSNLDAGRIIDEDTLCNFWIQKGGDAERKEAFSGTCRLESALDAFASWIKHMERLSGETAAMWGNGASFDNAIISDAYRGFKLTPPWKFWNDKCYRTIKAMYKEEVPMPEFDGKHNALNDARAQAQHLIQIHKFATDHFNLGDNLVKTFSRFAAESIVAGIDLAKGQDITTVHRYRPRTYAPILSFKKGGFVNSVSNVRRQKHKMKKVLKKRRRICPFISRLVRNSINYNSII